MADSTRIIELRRRVQLDPASIAFAALAEELRRAGQYDDAIATCKTGLQRHPAYLSARVTLGRSLLELGRFDEAQQELEHVLRVAPENLAAIRGLADIHHRRGELSEPSQPSTQQETAAPPSEASQLPPPPVVAQEPVPIHPVERVPIRPVRLSAVEATESAEPPASPPAERPADRAMDRPVSSAPVSEPDTAVLTGLESFLAAIVRARESMGPGRTSDR